MSLIQGPEPSLEYILRDHVSSGSGLPMSRVLPGSANIPESRGDAFCAVQFVSAQPLPKSDQELGRFAEGQVATDTWWMSQWRIPWIYEGADYHMMLFAMWCHSDAGLDAERKRSIVIQEDKTVSFTPVQVGTAWQQRWTLDLTMAFRLVLSQPQDSIDQVHVSSTLQLAGP